ncbi:tripartite tricarboxylate transporter substrate binding protein [Lentzea tibetensis]|uniref:tripartite tricarboxylate transporter substrate binding protein n=1 Tax=Lentzea tibetensis TaxID=2591470 RepID=UPI0016457875|nr:tripartite tricarboxylate transporter substrate binding protein [Lentzea tibetensis]
MQFTVPFPPGGSTDLVGRAVARAVEKPLGQSVPVANKPGANGAVGGKEVLASAPDGYNIALLVKSLFAITPLATKDQTAIDLDKLKIVGTLTTEDYVLVVNASSPHASLEDLLKAPSVKYATTGVGTGAQLSQALLFKSAGTNATDVPFDGGAPAVTALLGAQVDALAAAPSEVMQHVKAGKLRPLATFNEKRSSYLPDVPTVKEKGHDVVVDQRRFVVAPPGIPDAVAKKLADSFTAARKDADYDKFLKDNFVERWEVSEDEARQHIKDARAQYAAQVEKFGLRLGK